MPRQLQRTMTGFLAVGLLAATARAEERPNEPQPGAGAPVRIQVVGEGAGKPGGLVFQLGEPGKFWVGLQVEQEDGRLEVEQVQPDSPAAKAGLKAEDILLSVGGTPLKEVADLQKLVQASAGKPLALKVRRDGQEIAIEVKPERRATAQTIVITEEGEAKSADREQLQKLQKLLDQTKQAQIQARQQAEGAKNPGGGPWQRLHVPGAGGPAEIPADLEVTIKKKGNGPLRIKVRHAEHTWTVSEQELDKLPEPIRRHVTGMLPGHAVRLMPGATHPMMPQPGPHPGASGPHPEQPPEGARLHHELQQIKQQLHQLQEQVEALRLK